MPYYRLYFMDELSGHVTTFVEMFANEDGQASKAAEALRGHLAMELWCGDRKVKRWPRYFQQSRSGS
jgi:hypothetical protein